MARKDARWGQVVNGSFSVAIGMGSYAVELIAPTRLAVAVAACLGKAYVVSGYTGPFCEPAQLFEILELEEDKVKLKEIRKIGKKGGEK